MPTFKHPCPHCGKYIPRDVARCEFCGTADPFNPANAPAKPAQSVEATPQPAPAANKCTGCGAPLAEGARFCTVCGTLAAG
jgi:hypothetical protein